MNEILYCAIVFHSVVLSRENVFQSKYRQQLQFSSLGYGLSCWRPGFDFC